MSENVIRLGEVFRCRGRGTVYTERFENVVFIQNQFQDNMGMNHVASSMRNFFANFGSLLSGNVRYDIMSICRVIPSPKQFETSVPILGLAGNAGTSDLPNMDCYMLKLFTAVNARHRKGRMYLPGVTRAHFDNGGWTAQGLNVMGQIRANLLNTVSVQSNTGFILGVFTRGDHDTLFEPITDLQWSAYPCTQRRRRATFS